MGVFSFLSPTNICSRSNVRSCTCSKHWPAAPVSNHRTSCKRRNCSYKAIPKAARSLLPRTMCGSNTLGPRLRPSVSPGVWVELARRVRCQATRQRNLSSGWPRMGRTGRRGPAYRRRRTNEKNRQGSTIPLHDDLAADLRPWFVSKAGAGQGGYEAVLSFQQPKNSPRDAKLFKVPTGLIRILNQDLIAAGIAKRDKRGRTIDVHAMRHTLGTLLSKGGVAPRTAQAAMRHSSIDLTMNVYTDPKLLDVAGALDSLPNLSLDHKPTAVPNVLSATGTTDSTPSQFAPKFAPTTGKPSTNWSIPDRTAVDGGKPDRRMKNVASTKADKEIRPLSSSDKGRLKVGATGFEPAASTSRT